VLFCDHNSYNEMQENTFFFYSKLTIQILSEYLLTMLEWTVACSMYLAMPVTKAFLSSKLVLKFGCRESKMQNLVLDRQKNFCIYCKYQHTLVWGCLVFFSLKSTYAFS